MAAMPSITRSGTPKNLRAELDDRVLAAVERLLDEGLKYTEISVARIIEEAGIARSTFYVHFRDKTDLLKRLAGTLRQNLFDVANDWRREGAGRGLDSLTAMFTKVVALHRQHAAVMAAFVETAAYDNEIRNFHSSVLEAIEATVREKLEADQAAGRTDPGVSAVAAGRFIIWCAASAIGEQLRVDDGRGDEVFARELASLWWYGALHRPPS
jgi:AcrR family transcriptional regulator